MLNLWVIGSGSCVAVKYHDRKSKNDATELLLGQIISGRLAADRFYQLNLFTPMVS